MNSAIVCLCFALIVLTASSRKANAGQNVIIQHKDIDILFYNTTEDILNFNKALQFCQTLNGSLLQIKDNAIQTVVTQQLALLENSVNKSLCGSTCWNLGYWVGAVENNGQWEWLDGTPINNTEFSNWYVNQPNGDYISKNYAMKVMPVSKVEQTEDLLGKWGDDNINQKKNFICQRKSPCFKICNNGGTCEIDPNTQAKYCKCVNNYSGKTCKIEPNITVNIIDTQQKRYEYKYFNLPRQNYSEAEKLCDQQGNGYHLVKVNSSVIQSDIDNQIRHWDDDFDVNSWEWSWEAGYWAGGDNSKGDWFWLDGKTLILTSSSPFSYENWLGDLYLNKNTLYALQIRSLDTYYDHENNVTYTNTTGKWVPALIWEKKGFICQKLYDPCEGQPCLNSGTCVLKFNLTQTLYECECLKDFYGDLCQYDSCSTNPCQNGGTCVPLDSECDLNIIEGSGTDQCMETNITYMCMCGEGFFGTNCTEDICTTNPCLNNGTCTPNGTDYQCSCNDGYYGKNCSLDPCSIVPCENNGNCSVHNSTYKCECGDGFFGKNCSHDICTTNPCLNNGTCTPNGTDYQCSCNHGYYGKNCSLVLDICTTNPCLNNGTCTPNGTDYQCSCDDGYYGKNCSLDPCSIEPCGSNGNCTVNNATYECKCENGFFGMNCSLDSCSQNPCENGGICNVRGNSYTCDCTFSYTGKNCTKENFVNSTIGYSIYANGDVSFNFHNSSMECIGLGGGLAIVKNSTVQELIESYISNIHGYKFWLGARKVSGEWVWLDGSTILEGDFQKWTPDLRNYSGDCLSLQRDMVVDEFYWIPMVCEAQLGYVCEKSANGKDSCMSSPCLNNGLCVSSGAHFYCNCSGTFGGTFCEIPLFVPEVPSPFEPWLIAVIVISSALLLLAIGFLCYFVHRYRQKKKRELKKLTTFHLGNYDNSSFHPASNPQSNRIPSDQLPNKYTEFSSFNNRAFISQFEDITNISSTIPLPATAAKSVHNKTKNRYANVYPSDNQRVILHGKSGADYINASFIDSYKIQKKFIAAQGPTRETTVDFWRMIWQQNCQIIVMLTNLFEDGRQKCERYWPDMGFVDRFGPINVQARDEVINRSYAVRTFDVFTADAKKEDSCRSVTQFHYNSWPDHGVPVSTTAFLEFYDEVMDTYQRDCVITPILVHCSAGVGRTGTFIGLDSLLNEHKQTGSVNVFDAVLAMRKRRTLMVQTEAQYIFLHRLLVEVLFLPRTEFFIVDIDEVMSDLAKKDDNSITGYEKEFDNLDFIGPVDTLKEIALRTKNQSKNKFLNVLPYDKSILKLPPLDGSDSQPAYYNASLILCDLGHIIASQCPFEDTTVDFWHAVWHSDTKTIVMVTSKEEEHELYQYYPKRAGMPDDFGNLSVTLNKQEKQATYTKRLLRIENKQNQSKMDVKHLHYHSWPTTHPPQKESVLEFLDVIKRSHQREKGALLIHCSDGSGRTGVLMTLLKLIDKLNHGASKLDVFRTVKDLRDIRPGFVSNKQHYHFIYSSLACYLSNNFLNEANC